MNAGARRMLLLVRFCLFFLLLTYLFYRGIDWVTAHVLPLNPYEEPKGRAVKVIMPVAPEPGGAGKRMWDHVRTFLQYGE